MGDTEQKEKIEEEEMTVDNDKLSLLQQSQQSKVSKDKNFVLVIEQDLTTN